MNKQIITLRWRDSLKRRPAQFASSAIERLEERTLLSGITPSIDGTGNNIANPDWGSTDTDLLRTTTVEYGDGISSPAGEDRPSAREVSNIVVAQETTALNSRHLSDIAWIWGQFLDHDIDLTEGGHVVEEFDIDVPAGDTWFDPFGTGTATIDLSRSIYNPETGTSTDNPRQQINQITAFIDGSVVYGSDAERAAALRTFVGGRLKTSAGNLLPFNEAGLANAGGTSSSLFLAGDVRANENIALTSMHTIFMREHNRLADAFASENPSWSDEQIYQAARRVVTAEIQAITYNEFLPALLGEGAISEYAGYDATVNPGIANIFSTAAYRLGHSLLSSELLRLNPDGSTADEGNISLSKAFFSPQEVITNGIDSVLQGAAANTAQELDSQIVDDVRNFLFGPPGAGGFDLASLNIQRGRDHGLPDYNQARVDLGLAPVTSFADITSDISLQQKLEQAYGSVDNIDVWVGGLSEDHVPGSSMGELFQTILVDQFERLRDGDRFWYQNQFSGAELFEIENTTLSDIIERNSQVRNLQNNVFYDPSVFYYRTDASQSSVNIALRMDKYRIMIRDINAQKALDWIMLDGISTIKIVGVRNQDTRLVVDVAETAHMGVMNLEVFAHGNEDRLIFKNIPLQPLPKNDGLAFADDMTIHYHDFEWVRPFNFRDQNRTSPAPAPNDKHRKNDTMRLAISEIQDRNTKHHKRQKEQKPSSFAASTIDSVFITLRDVLFV